MAATESKGAEFKFTIELLRDYAAAALTNSEHLLDEASILYKNGHIARAYFLAVASLEETGKASMAFDAQGRNLASSAVTARLRQAFEDHSQKVTAAFTAMLKASSNLRKDVQTAVDLMIAVKRGREPSMYSDISYEECKVLEPSKRVRDIAARDCIRLAKDCLAHAKKHIAESKPDVRTVADDQMYGMKNKQFHKMLGTEGFWWYHIQRLEAGEKDLASTVVAYHREYFSKGKEFRRPSDEAKE